MSTPSSALDAEELLHLAIAASDRDQTDRAIGLLKQAIEVAPRFAKAHYLLGAEHAQIGLFERAINDMQRAVDLDPKLDAARFQLGLLLIGAGRVTDAENVWSALDRLGPDHAFVHFKQGLLRLAQDDFAGCLQHLRAGLAGNDFNPPLNQDMQKVIARVEPLQATRAAAGGEVSGGGDDADLRSHLFVNAYKGIKH